MVSEIVILAAIARAAKGLKVIDAVASATRDRQNVILMQVLAASTPSAYLTAKDQQRLPFVLGVRTARPRLLQSALASRCVLHDHHGGARISAALRCGVPNEHHPLGDLVAEIAFGRNEGRCHCIALRAWAWMPWVAVVRSMVGQNILAIWVALQRACVGRRGWRSCLKAHMACWRGHASA